MKIIGNKKHSVPFRINDAKKTLKFDTPFVIKEAYNSIRTNIMFINMGQKCPTYIITSPMPGDGKTINCINLAISFAMLGKRTLLIDADMRKPEIHHYFESSHESGFSEILAGIETEIGFESTNIPQLKYLRAGKVPPNPAELLLSNKFDQLIKNAQEIFDYIFIDTPPVCMVTDATILSKRVTGYILIIKNGKSDTNFIKRAVRNLEQVGANIVGFILNDVNSKSQSIYKIHDVRKHYKYDYVKIKNVK